MILDESDNIEFAAKESIKKTQQAYEDILNKRKQREEKLKQNKDVEQQVEPISKKESSGESLNLSSKKPSDNTLEKELGFSESSDNSEDDLDENQASNKENPEDDQLSNTSEDDFPPNQMIKTSRTNSEIQKATGNKNQSKALGSTCEQKLDNLDQNNSQLRDESGK